MARSALDLLDASVMVATFGAARATGLLHALGDGPNDDIDVLAARCHLDPRAVAATLDVLSSAGAIRVDGGTYTLGDDVDAWIGLDLLREMTIAVLEGRAPAGLDTLREWLDSYCEEHPILVASAGPQSAMTRRR